MQYVCPICGYVYDEAKEKTPFEKLPEDWVCPLCGAAKSLFIIKQDAAPVKRELPPIHMDEEFLHFTAGELAAICSNLARGCEKQYKAKESEMFKELAEYWAAVTPEVPDASLNKMEEMLQDDLNNGYPALRQAAQNEGERGVQRICVWGRKGNQQPVFPAPALSKKRRGAFWPTPPFGFAAYADSYIWETSLPSYVPYAKCPHGNLKRLKGGMPYEKAGGKKSAPMHKGLPVSLRLPYRRCRYRKQHY